jgi:hypothetical protein
MGIGKKNATIREAINVRRVSLGMPAQTADPIIEIINRDEQDVRPIVGATDLRAAREDSEP